MKTQKACERCGEQFWPIRLEHPLCWTCLKQDHKQRDNEKLRKAIAKRKAAQKANSNSWANLRAQQNDTVRDRRAKRLGR